MIKYWSWPIPDTHDGITYGPIAFIRPKCKGDKGLLVHEQVHVRQFWRMITCRKWCDLPPEVEAMTDNLTNGIATLKLDVEVEAYRAQHKAYGHGHDPTKLAERLATKYDGFEITTAQALKLITM